MELGYEPSSLATEAIPTTSSEISSLPPFGGSFPENLKFHGVNRYDALKDLSETRLGMRYEGEHANLLEISNK